MISYCQGEWTQSSEQIYEPEFSPFQGNDNSDRKIPQSTVPKSTQINTFTYAKAVVSPTCKA